MYIKSNKTIYSNEFKIWNISEFDILTTKLCDPSSEHPFNFQKLVISRVFDDYTGIQIINGHKEKRERKGEDKLRKECYKRRDCRRYMVVPSSSEIHVL